ncbi:2-amino-4-hydroxy-6-hydroxymethyldihydropteridine diphosphokinase [Enterobacteriaceae bacterium LUAb1]
MTRTWLALGSNQADPLAQTEAALNALHQIPDTAIAVVSPFYRTPPYGPPEQPDYLNAVVGLDTALSPLALLECTQRIEREQGRVRKAERWGPRTLDIDMLLFGSETIMTPRLTIPHYDMLNRAFMLVPLLAIAPGICLPDGRLLADLLDRLDCSMIQRW